MFFGGEGQPFPTVEPPKSGTIGSHEPTISSRAHFFEEYTLRLRPRQR